MRSKRAAMRLRAAPHVIGAIAKPRSTNGSGAFRRLKLRHRRAGEAPDFQRALDALRIVGLRARGGGRVHAREFRVQRPASPGGCLGVDLRAQSRPPPAARPCPAESAR
jgi:hypothetical protein